MKLFLFLALAASVYAQTPCDNYRSRQMWGSRVTTLQWMPMQPPSGFAIHHTGGQRCTSQAACDIQMRNLQNFHIDSNGYTDIAYNFCIGDTGLVYEGRGFGRLGAHAPGFNARALGHCFFGDHTLSIPTALALSTTQALITCARERGFLTAGHWVSTHRGDRESETDCPGNGLQNMVQNWDRFIEHP